MYCRTLNTLYTASALRRSHLACARGPLPCRVLMNHLQRDNEVRVPPLPSTPVFHIQPPASTLCVDTSKVAPHDGFVHMLSLVPTYLGCAMRYRRRNRLGWYLCHLTTAICNRHSAAFVRSIRRLLFVDVVKCLDFSFLVRSTRPSLDIFLYTLAAASLLRFSGSCSTT
jgi:hypothetical protein